MEKRFWRMKPEEADAFVRTYGMDQWTRKVAEDLNRAPEELADMPNPWLDIQDEPRQRLIEDVAPGVAERMKREAREMSERSEVRPGGA